MCQLRDKEKESMVAEREIDEKQRRNRLKRIRDDQIEAEIEGKYYPDDEK